MVIKKNISKEKIYLSKFILKGKNLQNLKKKNCGKNSQLIDKKRLHHSLMSKEEKRKNHALSSKKFVDGERCQIETNLLAKAQEEKPKL